MTSWFAGLFYLPRLFVNHAMVEDEATATRLALMERKLYRFMTILAVPAVALGLWLWLGYGIGGAWLHAKLTLVVALIGYHWHCGKLVKTFAEGRNARGHVFYRWFNEFPVLILTAAVILAVVKPF